MAIATAVTAPAPAAGVGLLIVLACLCLVAAAALAAAEEATGRLTRSAAQDFAADSARGAAVLTLADDPASAIRATGYARGLAQVAATVCVSVVLATVLPRWWQVLLVALAVMVVAIPLIELTTRRIGRRHPMQTLALLGPAVLTLQRGLSPLGRISRGQSRRGGRTATEEVQDEAENLRDMVDRVSERDQIDEDERDMLQSVFELGTTRVREVMVPRTDMVTISAGVPVRKALNLFVRSGYSRVPVIGDSVDDLLGVLYLKDALARTVRDPEQASTAVDEVMRAALFIPEMKVAGDLLDEMRAGAVHIAMVVDEYGGVAGLVTVEDLLEELVGELTDEHDRSEEAAVAAPDGSYVVPARFPLDELGELFDLDISDDEVTTAAGLLTKALGRVPIPGSVATSHGIGLEALDVQGRRRRLHTLRVWREQPGPPTTSSGEDHEGHQL